MKFIATTSDKIKDIAIVNGQMIFSRDDRVIYLDSDQRTSFQTIITLVDENQRLNLVSPVSGFYFVIETKNFWYYENDSWSLIAGEKQNLFYQSKNDFPSVGQTDLLYIDSKSHIMYEWDTNSNDYIAMNISCWEEIS